MRVLVFAFSLLIPSALAERLPVKSFDTSNGLAHNRVNCIVQTRDGFIWFCTDDGLSRFDGNTFVNYTRAHGLPHAHVNAMLQSRAGTLWLATDGGLARFEPFSDNKLFISFRLPGGEDAQHLNGIAEDNEGTIWCATSDGLFRAVVSGPSPVFQPISLDSPAPPYSERNKSHFTSVFIDSRYRIWVGTVRRGAFLREQQGEWRWFGMPHGLPDNFVDAFWEDRSGGVWAGMRSGGAARLATLSRAPWITIREAVPRPALGPEVRAGLVTSDGSLWFAGSGLARRLPGDSRHAATRKYGPPSGLTDFTILQLAEDRDHNLWLGTHHGGVIRMPLEGFLTYDQADGFQPGDRQTFLEASSGELCVWSGLERRRTLRCLNDQRFEPVATPRNYINNWSGDKPKVDRSGWWWFPSETGLLRFQAPRPAGLARASAAFIAPGMDRLFTKSVFEDSHGDIWIGAFDRIVRWERSTGSVRHFRRDEIGQGDLEVSAFAEPTPGVIWIGQQYRGPLFRCIDGRLEILPRIEGAEMVHDLHADSQGRLWIATSGAGLVRVDDPAAERPHFHSISKPEGLSSSDTYAIVEDRWGRLHVATASGVDRLSAGGKFIRAFTASDGLASGRILAAARDRSGDLWFSTATGISRLSPLPDQTPEAPQVRLSSFRVGGRPEHISQLGQSTVGPFEFGPDHDQIQVEFTAIDLRPGARLSFQTSLGDGDPVWSQPSTERVASFARLSPGAYTLRVRAINEAGIASAQPATVKFRILAPVWQRWWFLLGSACFLAAAGYSLHRARIAHVLALERMRSRISADLHDDIGSTLSRVVLLSEVARSRLGTAPADSARLLEDIASAGRELLDGMSDIVWAVDPRLDHVADLALRIRDFAGGSLDETGISWRFDVIGDESLLPLAPEHRRHIYLLFKEAIRNAIRHSNCSSLHMTLACSPGALSGEITDNGRGITDDRPPGNGRRNMQARVTALGGHLEVQSLPGQGTAIKFRVPLHFGRKK